MRTETTTNDADMQESAPMRPIDQMREATEVLARRIAELEAALDVALEAFETYFNQYPHMQKGYTLDAIEILKEVRK